MICDCCTQEMSDEATESCEHDVDPNVIEGTERCPDCNVKPGGTHHWGCDMERCSVCDAQKIMGCAHTRDVGPDTEQHDADQARWRGKW